MSDLSFFQTQAAQFTLLNQSDEQLRNNQVGAISALQAHFTLSEQPALIAMPTGSGKTAVLIASAFILKASRVLVITPSVVVREQIAEAFRTLHILKKTGVLPNDIQAPQVKEIEGQLANSSDWEELRQFDVVVAAPPSISPSSGRVAEPPIGIFDLILIDEAHHVAAPSWKALLAYFKGIRQVMCSATPFRNDRQDLGARIIYHYPLKRAQQEGIFGKISYEPIIGVPEEVDELIAKKAEEVFRRDQAAGLDHRLMVRTTKKSRAKELRSLYQKNTNLKLENIHSGLALKTIKQRLRKLREGEIDGVICVDMMGEGFDFPNLKIAAIHAPHKSLPVTLQFIGRFARTGFQDQSIGDATFIAEENGIKHDEYNLYSLDEPNWSEIIANLGDRRVQKEVDSQDFFDTFSRTLVVEEEHPASQLALGYLEPFHHVKIYQLGDEATFDLGARPESIKALYSEVSQDLNVSVIVWMEELKPRWLKSTLLSDVKYHLLVVFFDAEHNLLYVCSTRKEEDIYKAVLTAFVSAGAYELPAPLLKRVMTGWTNPELYSVGMRNRQAAIGQEAYRILAGSAAHNAVSNSDGKRFTRGHAFGASIEPSGKKTLGVSSSYAKVWSLRSADLHSLVQWCRELSAKLIDPSADGMSTPLDMLDGGIIIDRFPNSEEHTLLMVDWPGEVYKNSQCTISLQWTSPSYKQGITLKALDFDLRICPAESTEDTLRFDLHYKDEKLQCQLTLGCYPKHSVLPGQACQLTLASQITEREQSDFGLFLDGNAPIFWFDDLSMVTRNIKFKPLEFDSRLDQDTFKVVDWAAGNVEITEEITSKNPQMISIQEYLRNELAGQHEVVFFDHDTGEAADFITLDTTNNQAITVNFYHCKSSSEPKPGSRVDDMYEVLGQAMKCLRYRNRNLLHNHMLDREQKAVVRSGHSRFVTGTKTDLDAIFESSGSVLLSIIVWVVQPGLDSTKAYNEKDAKMYRLIESVQNTLRNDSSCLKVMCS